MIRIDSLVLYKTRPALVKAQGERYEIMTIDGEVVRVREKDIKLLYSEPVSRFPAPSKGGDFETARTMLTLDARGPVKTTWRELSELVFGTASPEGILACLAEASEGLHFMLNEEDPVARDDGDLRREMERRERKASEATEKMNFIAKARKARRGELLEKSEVHARFVGEIEALASGKITKSAIAQDIGISQTPEAAHQFLLDTGWWEPQRNPHPVRQGCPLKSPNLILGEERPGIRRLDLTGFTSWAIDNEWSNDPDDAVGWDGINFWIHVADPAASILPDDPVDREALERGATLYLPELTSPMLPDAALQRYGLGLEDTSPALSIKVSVDSDGFVNGTEIVASRVRVSRSHYGEADRFLAEGHPDFKKFSEMAELRHARRKANGAVEISIPESRVHVSRGEVSIDRTDEHQFSNIIREFMLLAGEACAQWAFKRSLAFPFYSQESPSIRQEDENSPKLSAQFARRRGMRAGILGPSPGAHRGLGLPFYCQSTSPLRRYQDLLGHMQIHAVLAGRQPMDADEVSRRCALAQAAQAPNRQAERLSESHWTCIWLSRHPGWVGEAILLSHAGQGAWSCFIPDLGLETRIRAGNSCSPDDVVKVKLTRCSVTTLETGFEVLS